MRNHYDQAGTAITAGRPAFFAGASAAAQMAALAATTICAACGASGPVAEMVVYLQAPGVVARCRTCTSILMVFTRMRGMICADLTGLAALETQ